MSWYVSAFVEDYTFKQSVFWLVVALNYKCNFRNVGREIKFASLYSACTKKTNKGFPKCSL